MTEEEQYPKEHDRRKKDMRPDAMVVPDDVLRILRVPAASRSQQLKAEMKGPITQAQRELYECEALEAVPLIFHQQIADTIAALAAVYASTEDQRRRELLRRIISRSEVTARTDYQFIRHFIRRSLRPILEAYGIPIPPSWMPCGTAPGQANNSSDSPQQPEPQVASTKTRDSQSASGPAVFTQKFWEQLGTEAAKTLCDLPKRLLRGYVAYKVFEFAAAHGADFLDTVECVLGIAKGEFEHYDEIKDVLKAIRDADPDRKARIRVLKGRDQGWDYVSTGLRMRGIECRAWSPESPRIRYYAFPLTHMLVFSLGDGQFLAFTGSDRDAVQATHDLFESDSSSLGAES